MLLNNVIDVAKRVPIEHNVSIRVFDAFTGKLLQEHTGHNAATNSMLTGIGHYLTGAGVLNQASDLLVDFIPRYISLGTMGLMNQDEDANGLPAGIGVVDSRSNYTISTALPVGTPPEDHYAVYQKDENGEYTIVVGTYPTLADAEAVIDNQSEYNRFADYMMQTPGYGSDGYALRKPSEANNRAYLGLGPMYANRYYDGQDGRENKTIDCELISASFPRAQISFRDIVPEYEAEVPETIDVVFSAMISTGALAQFREPGRNYLFITEAGLWSRRSWDSSETNGDNGLLAGYRIAPPDSENWDMADPANRLILKKNVIRVGINQVVQVIWKVQIGSVKQLTGVEQLYPDIAYKLQWVEL
jgi:hypothetical protein